MLSANAAAVVEQTFRAEHSRLLGALIAALGDFDLAEDALQEALSPRSSAGRPEGLPRNPVAWMTTVARRKAIDRLPRDQAFQRNQAALAFELGIAGPAPLDEDEVDERTCPDERLKLIFTCSHPALAAEAQIALSLRTLGGLDTAAIARAFLVAVPIMNQRLTRVKAKIRQAGIPFQVPSSERLPERLETVLRVVYLIFNEGLHGHRRRRPHPSGVVR
jgi:RNA polymerase sigma-70 factor (ECF subfamily)